ncbi:hypothetical protein [Mangrovihabitans endophyticus]|uniref:Uncharacterized protein n=1 Tax=Mangrovihabitans endophyticus TaxID=1751298 RepID=A0A8J3FNT5_9ACTN|nr:hypothetical protein [Mangrovihabitans endophyticus]GGK95958.1 hypothetical protein GCM10012284_32660 [Mangrovihabitans endophyticus]
MDDGMNDLKRLALLDPARGREPSATERARSEAFIERTIVGGVQAAPAHPARRRWLIAGAVAAVATGVVGAIAVPILIPGAAERAVASWTAMPTARTGDQVLPQATRCGESDVGGATKPTAADVLLAEQRGEATLLIMRKGETIVECLSADGDQFASMGLADGSATPALPPGVPADLQTMSSVGDGDDTWSNIVGLAGPQVTGVEVRLNSGAVLQASVKSGWWAAWWPGPEGGEVDALTVTVHTDGKATSYRPSDMA